MLLGIIIAFICRVISLAVIAAIALSFVPSVDLVTVHQKIIYEVELIGGPLIFIFCGYLIYQCRTRKKSINH